LNFLQELVQPITVIWVAMPCAMATASRAADMTMIL
jgi:hypothetical protein